LLSMLGLITRGRRFLMSKTGLRDPKLTIDPAKVKRPAAERIKRGDLAHLGCAS
jgi:hypothetical protein